MPAPFNDRLRETVRTTGSRLCLGLDLDPTRSSQLHDSSLASLKAAAEQVVVATSGLVWGYKLNFAFFERHGSPGFAWLEELAATIRARAGRVIIIGDAKRGDIGSSARFYAETIFDHLSLDAATVNPYLGWDSLEPFIAAPDKGAFVLCLTSNPGSADLQRFPGQPSPGTAAGLYLKVATWAQDRNASNNVGLVVGATHADDLAAIRKAAPRLPFLVPGVGAQGGSLTAAVRCGTRDAPSIITVSRSVLYAGAGALDEIVTAVKKINRQIDQISSAHGV